MKIKEKIIEDWEKEFDEEFPRWKNTKFDFKTGDMEYVQICGDETVKLFIRKLLSLQKREVIESLPEEDKDNKWSDTETGENGWNACLNQLKQTLTK